MIQERNREITQRFSTSGTIVNQDDEDLEGKSRGRKEGKEGRKKGRRMEGGIQQYFSL